MFSNLGWGAVEGSKNPSVHVCCFCRFQTGLGTDPPPAGGVGSRSLWRWGGVELSKIPPLFTSRCDVGDSVFTESSLMHSLSLVKVADTHDISHLSWKTGGGKRKKVFQNLYSLVVR